MKIIVIGATGMIGARIVDEASDRGHDVTKVSRSGGDGIDKADASDTQRLVGLIGGHDAIVLAIAPPRDGSDSVEPLLDAGRSVLAAAREAEIKRVVIVGGAGSLLLPDGSRLVDSADFPEMYKAEALAQAELLAMIRAGADDLDWTYVSPAALIEPGVRSGNYQVGEDDLLVDGAGNSHVSAEDFAAGLVDQLEAGSNIGRRITIAST